MRRREVGAGQGSASIDPTAPLRGVAPSGWGFGCGTVLRQQDVVTGVGDRPDPHVPTARAEVLLMKPDAP